MIREKCLEIGTVSKTHGYDGSVRIDLDDIESLSLNKKEPLFLRIQQKLVPFFMQSFQQSDSSLIVRFEDINASEEARQLCGHRVFAREKAVTKGLSTVLDQIIGYQVIDTEKGALGTITDYSDSTVQPVLQMSYRDQEVLIPFVEEIILEIDEKNKYLKVELPEGLLDLYLNSSPDEN